MTSLDDLDVYRMTPFERMRLATLSFIWAMFILAFSNLLRVLTKP
jgi:hypothetical protein